MHIPFNALFLYFIQNIFERIPKLFLLLSSSRSVFFAPASHSEQSVSQYTAEAAAQVERNISGHQLRVMLRPQAIVVKTVQTGAPSDRVKRLQHQHQSSGQSDGGWICLRLRELSR